MTNANPDYHSLSTIAVRVTVREFRAATDALIRRCDGINATTTHGEIARWVDECRTSAQRLAAMGCARATSADWDHRECALDRSASLIARVLHGEIRRKPAAPRLRVVS